MSLLFNMLSRLVVTFLSRSKWLLISWLQYLGAPQNKFSHCFHCFPIYLPWSDGNRCHDLCFLNVEIQVSFFSQSSFTFIKTLFSPFLLSVIRLIFCSLTCWSKGLGRGVSQHEQAEWGPPSELRIAMDSMTKRQHPLWASGHWLGVSFSFRHGHAHPYPLRWFVHRSAFTEGPLWTGQGCLGCLQIIVSSILKKKSREAALLYIL